MKLDDLKKMDEGALKAKLVELSKEKMGLRFQKSGGQLEKTHPIKETRRTMARIKTLLSQHAVKA